MNDHYESIRMGNRVNNKTLGIQEKDYLDIDTNTMKTNYQQWWMVFQNAGRQELGPGWALLFPDNGARQPKVMEALAEEVQESNGAQTNFEYTRGGGLSPYKTPMIRPQYNQTQDSQQQNKEGTPQVNRNLQPQTPQSSNGNFANSIREAAKTIIMCIGATIGPNIRRRVAASTSPWQRAMQSNDLLQVMRIITTEYKNITKPPKLELASLIREMAEIRESDINVAHTMQKQEQIYYQIETARQSIIEYDNISARYMIEQILVDIQLEAYEHPRIRQEIQRSRASNNIPRTQDAIRGYIQQLQSIIGIQIKEDNHNTSEYQARPKAVCYQYFTRGGQCERGDRCKFSHQEKDRVECIHGSQCERINNGCPHIHKQAKSMKPQQYRHQNIPKRKPLTPTDPKKRAREREYDHERNVKEARHDTTEQDDEEELEGWNVETERERETQEDQEYNPQDQRRSEEEQYQEGVQETHHYTHHQVMGQYDNQQD